MVPSLLWLMLESAAILYSKGKVALQADGAAKFPACCAQRDFPTMTNRQTTFPLRHILRAGLSVAARGFLFLAGGRAPPPSAPPPPPPGAPPGCARGGPYLPNTSASGRSAASTQRG